MEYTKDTTTTTIPEITCEYCDYKGNCKCLKLNYDGPNGSHLHKCGYNSKSSYYYECIHCKKKFRRKLIDAFGDFFCKCLAIYPCHTTETICKKCVLTTNSDYWGSSEVFRCVGCQRDLRPDLADTEVLTVLDYFLGDLLCRECIGDKMNNCLCTLDELEIDN